MLRFTLCFSLLLAFALSYQRLDFTEANGNSDGALEAASVETRCGWFSNPTPANVSLFDRDGEWIIGVQGGHQAEGDWGDFGKQWVKTNVNYGYGCACLKLELNRTTKEVTKIDNFRARPLAVCRKDRALKKWGFK